MNDGVHRRWTMVFGHEPPCYNVPSHRNMLKVLPSKVQLLLKYEESSFSRFVAKRVGQAPHPSIIRHFIFVPNRRFPPFRQLASASCMKTRGAGCSFRSRNLSSTKDIEELSFLCWSRSWGGACWLQISVQFFGERWRRVPRRISGAIQRGT